METQEPAGEPGYIRHRYVIIRKWKSLGKTDIHIKCLLLENSFSPL